MTRGPMMTYCTRLRARIAGLMLGAALVSGVAGGVPGQPFVSVAAAEPANVEALIRQGNQLRSQGKDALALPYFKKAYESERNPRTAAQLGLVEAQLGYFTASERHLTEALSTTRHPWVERIRGQLEKTLVNISERIGEIEVAGSPTGAQVVLNNKVVGILPMRPVRLDEGAVQVVVRSPGYIDHNVNLTITGGKRESLVVNLPQGGGSVGPEVAVGAPPPVRSRDEGRPLNRNELISESVHSEANQPKSGAPAWVRPASWVAGALAVTGLGLGTYQYLEKRRNEDLFNKHSLMSSNGKPVYDCAVGAPNRGAAGCSTLYDKAVSARKLALIGFQVGGVLAVSSIIGFVWSANSAASSASAALLASPDFQLALDPSGASAGLHWRF
ncbi:MAG TPA: PEGA domain-containing protein [Polyangia bacterium]